MGVLSMIKGGLFNSITKSGIKKHILEYQEKGMKEMEILNSSKGFELVQEVCAELNIKTEETDLGIKLFLNN